MTLSSPPVSPRRAEIDFGMLYSGLFLAMGAQLAFHQLWLQRFGLSAAEIGYVNAAALIVRIGAGLWIPALSDRLGRPRALMTLAAGVGALAALAHLAAAAHWQVYLLTIALAAVYSALIPMSDAHGYAAAERVGFSYRRARSAGSAAFLSATFLVGLLVEEAGVDLVILWIAAALGLAALGALRAPVVARADDADPGAPPLSAAGFLSDGGFRLFIAAVALIQASHAVYYVYGSVHWSRLGYSGTMIGALWALGVIAEIALWSVGAGLFRRLGPIGALILAGSGAALRWTVTAFDPPLWLLLPAQALHAASFGLTHLATLEFISRAAPKGSTTTAQGLVSAAGGGVAMAIGATLAARIYPEHAGLAYLQGAAFGALGALAAFRLGRVWSGRRLAAS